MASHNPPARGERADPDHKPTDTLPSDITIRPVSCRSYSHSKGEWGQNARYFKRSGNEGHFCTGLPSEMPEGKGRPAEIDTDQGNYERNQQGGKNGSKSLRKSSEEGHHDKDQPDVIRFPDRAYGMEKAFPLLPGTGTGGKSGPDPAAKVRTGKYRIHDKSEQQNAGGKVFIAQHGDPPFVSPGAAFSAGDDLNSSFRIPMVSAI
jgi:hypothetical protein